MSCRWASSHMTSLLSLVMLHDAHHMTSSCNITSFICPSCLMTKLRHVITSSSCDLTHDKARHVTWLMMWLTCLITKLHDGRDRASYERYVTWRPSWQSSIWAPWRACYDMTTCMSHHDLHATWRLLCHMAIICHMTGCIWHDDPHVTSRLSCHITMGWLWLVGSIK